MSVWYAGKVLCTSRVDTCISILIYTSSIGVDLNWNCTWFAIDYVLQEYCTMRSRLGHLCLQMDYLT